MTVGYNALILIEAHVVRSEKGGGRTASGKGERRRLRAWPESLEVGVDLHASTMYVCVLDERDNVKLQKNLKTDREIFLQAIAPLREDLVVGVECMFAWCSRICVRGKRFTSFSGTRFT